MRINTSLSTSFSTPFFIGLRYIKAKRRHQFISFISGFSLVGMALGTLALIVVLSVMNGFDREIKQRILSVVPHGFIDELPALQDWEGLSSEISTTPHLVASAPYISGYAMLSSSVERRTSPNCEPIDIVQGAELQGISPDLERKVSVIHRYMYRGSTEELRSGEFGIVLGRILASHLCVGIGDSMLMTLSDISITPAGIFPRTKRFTVVGIFKVGAQVDQSLAMIHLGDAQKMFRYGDKVQGLRVKFDDIYQAQEKIAVLQKQLGDQYQLTDWSQTQGSLFQAVQMEKRMVTLLLLIIVAVAALNIVTGLMLMVVDKRGDIAVLRTLGMTTKHIMCIFITQGSVVGMVGIAVGAVFGCLLAVSISEVIAAFEALFGIYVFDPNVYFISQIPSELRWGDVLFICVSGISMSILATLYPAYCAAQIAPAEVLRYE
jgi:lipoprotein-releasing system permease protein